MIRPRLSAVGNIDFVNNMAYTRRFIGNSARLANLIRAYFLLLLQIRYSWYLYYARRNSRGVRRAC